MFQFGQFRSILLTDTAVKTLFATIVSLLLMSLPSWAQDQGSITDRVAKVESFLEFLKSENPTIKRAAIEEGVMSSDPLIRDVAIKEGFGDEDISVRKAALIGVLNTQDSLIIEVPSDLAKNDDTAAQWANRIIEMNSERPIKADSFQVRARNVFTCAVRGDEMLCREYYGQFFNLKIAPNGELRGDAGKLPDTVPIRVRVF